MTSSTFFAGAALERLSDAVLRQQHGDAHRPDEPPPVSGHLELSFVTRGILIQAALQRG